MTYRSLHAADLPELLRLEQAYMREVEPDSLAAWTAALHRNRALWVECLPTGGAITDADGALAGLALWRLRPGVATLVTIHVVPAHRRSGIGGRLLDAFVASATAAGAGRAALGVHEANGGAERLYTTHGFRLVGTDGAYRMFERDLVVA
ncbi:UNVERIFIED_ORG: GNAT family N-acetyltransferase [Bacillus sp. AZ43]